MIVPEGHRIVLDTPEVKETYGKTNILKTVQTQQDELLTSMIGRVVALGPTAGNCFKDGISKNEGMKAQVGDSIVISKHSGVLVADPVDGKKYRIINDEDVMAVIKEK